MNSAGDVPLLTPQSTSPRRPDDSTPPNTENPDEAQAETHNGPDGFTPRPKKRRRDIRACSNCRRSKVKCDGNAPCRRCIIGKKQNCDYPDVYKDSTTERLEALEAEQRSLRSQLESLQTSAATMDIDETSGSRAPSLPIVHTNTTLIQGGRQNAFEQPLQTPRSLISGGSVVHEDRSGHSAAGHNQSISPRVVQVPRGYSLQTADGPNVVARGIISEQQASFWFASFFAGSHVFVPAFCPQVDTFDSIASRSSILFDAIVSIGCRAEEGPQSSNYQKLQGIVRERVANLVSSMPTATTSLQLEAIQALVLLASFSENGWLFVSFALRSAILLHLPSKVEELMTRMSARHRKLPAVTTEEAELRLYREARVWWSVFNLEHILSLDGEKAPSISCAHDPSRVRTLIYHQSANALDLRLLSQVELNIKRSRAHSAIASFWASVAPVPDEELSYVVRDSCLELDLWLDEWAAMVWQHRPKYASTREQSTAVLNLRVQHAWAVITLHLKAVSNTGMDNIAAMTSSQLAMVTVAKESAVQHLRLLLKAPTPAHTPEAGSGDEYLTPDDVRSTYLAGFKYTMDFVWAKCAFSILLAFRLSMLLRDPPQRMMDLVRDAHAVLEALKEHYTGNMAYFQILQVSTEKFEKALQTWMDEQSRINAEIDFEAYAPREFLFEWSFPGLNLRHVPLGWQDLFLDLESTF